MGETCLQGRAEGSEAVQTVEQVLEEDLPIRTGNPQPTQNLEEVDPSIPGFDAVPEVVGFVQTKT